MSTSSSLWQTERRTFLKINCNYSRVLSLPLLTIKKNLNIQNCSALNICKQDEKFFELPKSVATEQTKCCHTKTRVDIVKIQVYV